MPWETGPLLGKPPTWRTWARLVWDAFRLAMLGSEREDTMRNNRMEEGGTESAPRKRIFSGATTLDVGAWRKAEVRITVPRRFRADSVTVAPKTATIESIEWFDPEGETRDLRVRVANGSNVATRLYVTVTGEVRGNG